MTLAVTRCGTALLTVVTVLTVATVAMLTACTSPPAPAPVPEGPAPTSSSSNAPVDTKFDPDADASENKAHFDSIASRVSADNRTPRGRKFVDALVAGGFDKAAMEVTFDKTTIDLFSDNVQFSVLINGSCIIGQDGNVGYQSAVLPALTTGTCLVGETRPINW